MEPVKIFPALCILALLFCAGCSDQSQARTTAAPSATVPVVTTTVPTPQTTITTPAVPDLIREFECDKRPYHYGTYIPFTY